MGKIRKAVIPAAGYGTRFLPITKIVPKELLPIGNKPAIHYVVEEAIAAGVEEIILICHRSKTEIVDYFRPDPSLKRFLEKKGKTKEVEELEKIERLADFKVVYQEEPLGLGHAVWSAREAVGDEPFLVILPDVLLVKGWLAIRQLIEICSEKEDWGMLLERINRKDISSYGIVKGKKLTEEIFSVEGAVEKPRIEEAPSELAILGRYLFNSKIFDLLEKLNPGALGEIQLTDAIHLLAKEKEGRGVIYEGRLFDVGVPQGLKEAVESYEEAEATSRARP